MNRWTENKKLLRDLLACYSAFLLSDQVFKYSAEFSSVRASITSLAGESLNKQQAKEMVVQSTLDNIPNIR